MPGRSFSSEKYRYGFNGQEKSDEIDPAGNSMTAEFWQYDARIGRRWNLEPLAVKYPALSPYMALGNNPIEFIDVNGDVPNPFRVLWDQLHRSFISNTRFNLILEGTKKGMFKDGGWVPSITRLGRIFENTVIESMGEVKNTKPFRPSPTSPRAVIPDVVGESVFNRIDLSNVPGGGQTQRIVFPEAHFTDAKLATNIKLVPDFNPEQIKIMIDVLSEKKGGYINGKWDATIKASDYGMAVLTFITPSDTNVGVDLIKYATMKNVKLFQATTEQDEKNPNRIRINHLHVPLNIVKTEQTVTSPSHPSQSAEMNFDQK